MPSSSRGTWWLLAVVVGIGSVLIAGCGGGGGDTATGTVTGFVADNSTLSNLAGATVRVGTTGSATTDASGAFIVTGVPAGTRTLTVSLAGYETYSTVITVTTGTSAQGTVYLAQGQQSGKGHVTGTVTDSSVPVSGATVTAGGKSAITKADGTYAIYNLTPGNVTVEGSLGSKSGYKTVTVAESTTVAANISLSLTPPPPPDI